LASAEVKRFSDLPKVLEKASTEDLLLAGSTQWMLQFGGWAAILLGLLSAGILIVLWFAQPPRVERYPIKRRHHRRV
jgi:hypothetical protein